MKIIEISPGEFKTYGTIPKTWKVNGENWENFHLADPQLHYSVGFRDLIYPPYNSTTQKLGPIIWSGDDITFQVIDLPPEEVKAKLINNEAFEKAKLIKEKLDKQIETEIQLLTDNGEILANKKGYPIWETFEIGYEFPVNFILKDFVGPELELIVFKSKLAHTKSLTNKPETNTTNWGSITMAEWVSGQVYNIGDQITFNGKIYESQINNNTNNPGSSSKNIWLEIKA